MKELIGKKIIRLRISEDQMELAFDTDQGEIAYQTYGDCCSETWFADITGVRSLIGGTVSASEEVDMDGYNVDDGRCRQDYDQAYGWKITTDKGYADIVFRNSSNGYYGGDIELMQSPSSGATIVITDDWEA